MNTPHDRSELEQEIQDKLYWLIRNYQRTEGPEYDLTNEIAGFVELFAQRDRQHKERLLAAIKGASMMSEDEIKEKIEEVYGS